MAEHLGSGIGEVHAAAAAVLDFRFGGFPARNTALGRSSTPEERGYLSQRGAGW